MKDTELAWVPNPENNSSITHVLMYRVRRKSRSTGFTETHGGFWTPWEEVPDKTMEEIEDDNRRAAAKG